VQSSPAVYHCSPAGSHSLASPSVRSLFFFHDSATPEIYTLSYTTLFRSPLMVGPVRTVGTVALPSTGGAAGLPGLTGVPGLPSRSEEHTSELQSLAYLVCRLLLEKKNNQIHALPRVLPLAHVVVCHELLL